MENNFEEFAVRHIKLINQSFVSELLDSILESFFFEEENKRKIGYIYLRNIPGIKLLEERVNGIEELAISIRKNLNYGNHKRSLHMTIMLDYKVKEIQKELDSFKILKPD